MEDKVLVRQILVCPWCNEMTQLQWRPAPKNIVERDTGTSKNTIYLIFDGCRENSNEISKHQRNMSSFEYETALINKVRECILSNSQYSQILCNEYTNVSSVVMYRIFIPETNVTGSDGIYTRTVIDESFIMNVSPPYNT